VIVAHCFACIFFSLGWRLRCVGGVGYEETWLDLLEHPRVELPVCGLVLPGSGGDDAPVPPPAVNMTAQAFLSGGAVGQPHWLEMWVLSLHWAISSMSSLGYGRGPVAVTIAEFGFTIFCQVLGACMYAAIFGNIARLLAKLDAPGARYRAQRDKIDEFVAFHELPTQLTSKLHAYCKFLFAVNHGFDVGQISGALPPNLQHELLLQLHAPLVKSVPMFEDCDDSFIKAIVLQLRPQVLLGGDAAFKANEAGTEMYFIMRGEMRMMDESLKVCYNALYSGAYFGELAMLTGQPRTATALAVTDCVLFYINQSDFNLVARKWPKALAKILSKAKERLGRINNANSKSLAVQLGERLTHVAYIISEEKVGLLDMGRQSTFGVGLADEPAPAAANGPGRESTDAPGGESASFTRKESRRDKRPSCIGLGGTGANMERQSTRFDTMEDAQEKALCGSSSALWGAFPRRGSAFCDASVEDAAEQLLQQEQQQQRNSTRKTSDAFVMGGVCGGGGGDAPAPASMAPSPSSSFKRQQQQQQQQQAYGLLPPPSDPHFRQWQRSMEVGVNQAREGVQLILERLGASDDNACAAWSGPGIGGFSAMNASFKQPMQAQAGSGGGVGGGVVVGSGGGVVGGGTTDEQQGSGKQRRRSAQFLNSVCEQQTDVVVARDGGAEVMETVMQRRGGAQSPILSA
jgi:CRP-like cAMP-binding protein